MNSVTQVAAALAAQRRNAESLPVAAAKENAGAEPALLETGEGNCCFETLFFGEGANSQDRGVLLSTRLLDLTMSFEL
jgi:hypothetical protein